MSKWIGVIIGSESHEMLATIVPDNEAQLDNPRWLLMHKSDNEPIRMVKMLYEDFANYMDEQDRKALIAAKA